MVKPEISSSTSRQPRKLNFGIQAYFNPTRRNMNKTNRSPYPSNTPPCTNRVKPKTSKSTSRQPRKLQFVMQAYFNPTRLNMNKN